MVRGRPRAGAELSYSNMCDGLCPQAKIVEAKATRQRERKDVTVFEADRAATVDVRSRSAGVTAQGGAAVFAQMNTYMFEESMAALQATTTRFAGRAQQKAELRSRRRRRQRTGHDRLSILVSTRLAAQAVRAISREKREWVWFKIGSRS